MLWLDNEADPLALSSREKVAAVLDRAKDAGFNIIVPDARNWFGQAFYRSRTAPRPDGFRGHPYPADFDFLATVCDEAHRRGMQVHAGLNMFVDGGKNASGRVGYAWENPGIQSVVHDRVVEVSVGDGFTTRAATVNDRGGSGVSVIAPPYGARLVRRNSAPNAADGIVGRNASRWVSGDSTATHWLRLKWPRPRVLARAELAFPKGFPLRSCRVLADCGEAATLADNAALTVSLALAAPKPARELRVEIADAGADGIARIEEIAVFDADGRNIAPEAVVAADSEMRRPPARIVAVSGGRVASVTGEDALSTGGLAVPADGALLVFENAGDAPAVAVGEPARAQSRTVLLREDEHPGGSLLYTNPADPAVQKRCLTIIDEVAANYPVEGVVLDRVRFDSFKTDFSDVSRRRFEGDMGVKVADWPADIGVPADPLTGAPLRKGPLHDKWLLWRARVIHGFFAEARKVTRRHGKLLGDYVGGWYQTYWEVGVNWGADDYDPSPEFAWAPPGYGRWGYARMLDYLSPGVYYGAVRKAGAADPASTVEGGCELARRVTRGAIPLAPGLYVPNLNSDGAFEDAVRACIETGGGVMVFSHTTLDKTNRWEAARRGMEAVPQHME
jgi:hypothetical protein